MAGNSPERKIFFNINKKKSGEDNHKKQDDEQNLVLTAFEISQYGNTITEKQMEAILKRHGLLKGD
ncbi:MAG TPA: hypothetical protein P5299_02565 [Candidatus Woesebacteria bacterium]|nr:hypothetical protein [Candidatus Woesebacteria bacterium]HRT40209.1 hypothetical protein [Candidatus Woesebacteria bacterium]